MHKTPPSTLLRSIGIAAVFLLPLFANGQQISPQTTPQTTLAKSATSIQCGDLKTSVRMNPVTKKLSVYRGGLEESTSYEVALGESKPFEEQVETPMATWIASESGYRLIPAAPDGQEPTRVIKLTPWSRIEGTVRRTAGPRTNLKVVVQWSENFYGPEHLQLSDLERRSIPVNFEYITHADVTANGQFVINHVPRGRCILLVQPRDDSEEATATFWRRIITIPSDQDAVQTDITIQGQTVTGALDLTDRARQHLVEVARSNGRLQATAGKAAVLLFPLQPEQVRNTRPTAESVLRDSLTANLATRHPLHVVIRTDAGNDFGFAQFVPLGQYSVQVQPVFQDGENYRIPHVWMTKQGPSEIRVVHGGDSDDDPFGGGPSTISMQLIQVDARSEPTDLQTTDPRMRNEVGSSDRDPATIQSNAAKWLSRQQASDRFEQEQAERRQQLDLLEQRLTKARELLEQRQQRREQIIQRMIQQPIDELDQHDVNATTFSMDQLSTLQIPGITPVTEMELGDITGNQVMAKVKREGKVVAQASMLVGDSIQIDDRWRIKLQALSNVLLGNDTARFEVIPLH